MKLGKAKLRQIIWAKSDGRCWYCGKQMNPWEDFCIDHIIAKKFSGNDEVENLVPCCRRCNSQKRTRTIKEYREWIEAGQGMWFSEAQIKYLKSHGIEIPKPRAEDHHIFWFEKEMQ